MAKNKPLTRSVKGLRRVVKGLKKHLSDQLQKRDGLAGLRFSSPPLSSISLIPARISQNMAVMPTQHAGDGTI
ncbi:MAG: hypothetical protein AB2L22_08185 [Syntrophales bacterium]